MSNSPPVSQSARQSPDVDVREVVGWGATTGFGLGGMIDVVLFHLVLQHHHLLSGYIDPRSDGGLRANILYDGLFVLLMLGIMFVGLGMLWRRVNGGNARVSNKILGGAILVGAGVFNVFDGIITHYVFGFHDVVHDTSVWNPHWVVVSLLLLGSGLGILYLANS